MAQRGDYSSLASRVLVNTGRSMGVREVTELAGSTTSGGTDDHRLKGP